MTRDCSVFEALEATGIIPVIKIDSPEAAAALGKALLDGGIPIAEVTFRTQAAAEAIAILSETCPQLLVGAGTVLSVEQVDRAVEAGAKFIVSPGLNPDVVQHCRRKAIPVIPGCCTPGDIEKALGFGLDTVKFFPAEASGGLNMLKALSAPYPAVKYIPTGGIDPTNLAGYLSFSNVLACGGSWMVRDELISQGRFDEITRLCGEAVKLVSGYRARGNASEYAGNGDQHIRRETQPVATGKVVCFGEIMMRLSPPGFQRFVQANSFDLCFGGSEANVSVSLAEFGVDAAFVTRLPDDPRGQSAVNELRRYSVDTGDIARGGDRIGIYFLEKGASQRPSKVIYDRKNSSFAQAKPGDFDWDSIFKGAAWFHFSGITPALGEAAAQLTLEAAAAAKKQGLKVSCDLNYRKNLWSPEKAGEVMAALMQQVDVFIANEEQVGTIFGIHAEDADDAATQLAGRFRLEKVAVTLRSGASASENQWSAMLLDGGEVFNSKSYSVHIVDRVGGGDAFAAGLIFALLKGYRSQEALEFAVAASCLKHSVEGDFNHVAVEEVRALLEGDGSGRVQR